MFDDTSIIKEVNILNKVLCYILVLIMLIVGKDPIYILIVDMFFLLLTKSFKKMFITNILLTGLVVLNIFFPHFLWIIKILFLVLYILLLKKVTKLSELRYVIEVTLYRFKNKKITYRLFYFIYFLKNFNNNIKRMLVLKDDYLIKLDFKFLYFIIKESYKKAKAARREFVVINSMRFYNYSEKRTYIEKITWESWDNTYLISHIIILVLTFFYGR